MKPRNPIAMRNHPRRSSNWKRFLPRIARVALSLRGALASPYGDDAAPSLMATNRTNCVRAIFYSRVGRRRRLRQKNARNTCTARKCRCDIRGDSRDSRTKTGETKSTNTLQVRMHFDSMAIAAHCQKLSDFAAMRGDVLTSLVVRVIKETQVEAPRRSLPRPTLASSRELRLFGNQKRGRFLKTRPRFSFVAMLACRFTVQWTGCKSLRR